MVQNGYMNFTHLSSCGARFLEYTLADKIDYPTILTSTALQSSLVVLIIMRARARTYRGARSVTSALAHAPRDCINSASSAGSSGHELKSRSIDENSVADTVVCWVFLETRER